MLHRYTYVWCDETPYGKAHTELWCVWRHVQYLLLTSGVMSYQHLSNWILGLSTTYENIITEPLWCSYFTKFRTSIVPAWEKRWLGFIGDLSSSDAGIREEINKLPHIYGFPMLRVTHSQPSLRSKTSERCFIRFNFYTTKQNTSMTHSSNQCIREISSTIKSWNGSGFATSDSTEQARYVGQKRSWRRPRGTDPPPNRFLISGWVSTTFLLGICDLWWGILYFWVCIWDEGFGTWDGRFGVWNVEFWWGIRQ